MPDNNQIVLLTNKQDIQLELAQCLSTNGVEFVSYSSISQFKKKPSGTPPVVAFIELDLFQQSTSEFIEHLRQIAPNCATIVFAKSAPVEQVVRVIKKGAFWFVKQPFDTLEVNNLVNIAIEIHNLKNTKNNYQQIISGLTTPQQIISKSKTMQDTLERIGTIASIPATVLLTGESGTGKSVLARLIHNLSDRTNEPFISFSCSAIPKDLLEAELFGYEKGAFTGANSARAGYIELASGGTLFLDEIGELSLELQPKLLTFLQSKTFNRLGSGHSTTADVRIIAATNRNLEAMCKDGSFREDLFFRINVLAINLPALRDRKEDIPALVDYFLTRISSNRKSLKKQLSKEALDVLINYHWTGNVRELENLLERVTAFSKNDVISPEELGLDKLQSEGSNNKTNKSFTGQTLSEIEKSALFETLEHYQGDKLKTALSLGVSLKTVYNLLKKHA